MYLIASLEMRKKLYIGAEMRPAVVCFWDDYWRRAGQLLANFSPVPSTGNIPRSLCQS